MAVVRRIREQGTAPQRHPSEVDLAVFSVPTAGLIQLTTYGSDHRKSGPKPSQTLQFDRTQARRLLDILDLFVHENQETLLERDVP